MNPNKELYYAIMNICDYLALHPETDEEIKRELRFMLPKLASAGDINVEALFDANDCGGCKSWDEFIEVLRELFKNGERD